MNNYTTRYRYEPFGETSITGASSTNPFQYAGRENDGTGLYHYRMRYYSPVMHRFIQEDPIGLMGGVNMYAYVRNNPLRYIDPFGLDKQEKADDDYPWFWYLACLIDPNCEPTVPPEYLPYIPMVGGAKGKEGATDIPSWAEGQRPQPGESGKDFAQRLMDEKYGPEAYRKGPGSEFNKLKKYGDRHF